MQGALKLVLEPILEADFSPSSYGFRPNRRADDAIAEIRLLAANTYEWVLEGDIKACFDEIDHAALMDRLRRRIKDKRILALVKAFLKAGILSEDGAERDTSTGTPQGGLLSPLLANLALSCLDEHFARQKGSEENRRTRRRHGLPNCRAIRYADLCGCRHKSAYAEDRIMPRTGGEGLRLTWSDGLGIRMRSA